jgi:hypothetical protein
MKNLPRSQAIHDIRSSLMTLTDEEHSMCEVAARLHIFCGGFAQWTFGELKQRHPTIVRSRQRITRKQLEDLANRWQIARQTAQGTALACDTQMHERAGLQVCHGWNDFSNDQLALFYAQILGEEVSVENDPAEPARAQV